MRRPFLSILGALAAAWICGCSSGQSSGGGSPDGGGDGGPGSAGCASFAPTTITAMRTAATSGCFELQHVALVARTSSTTAPRLFVQDAAGGDFSALMTRCSTTFLHACPASALATALTLASGRSVTVRGYYDHGKTTGFEELAIEGVVDDGTTVALPAPLTLSASDLARDAHLAPKWFQRVTANVDKLVMYDFSPAEMKLTGPCPAWEGFGMIAASASAAPAAGCAGTANPPGVSAPLASEILIGRQFFHAFKASTDCGCAAQHGQTLLAPTASVSGTIQGILIFEILKGGTTGFQVLEPTTAADFPVQ